jgi:hypothetical protein
MFNDKKWLDCSLYDNEGFFRGTAAFTDEQSASEYKEIYLACMRRHNEKSRNHNKNNMNIKLRIFTQDRLCDSINVPAYYFFKKRY